MSKLDRVSGTDMQEFGQGFLRATRDTHTPTDHLSGILSKTSIFFGKCEFGAVSPSLPTLARRGRSDRDVVPAAQLGCVFGERKYCQQSIGRDRAVKIKNKGSPKSVRTRCGLVAHSPSVVRFQKHLGPSTMRQTVVGWQMGCGHRRLGSPSSCTFQ